MIEIPEAVTNAAAIPLGWVEPHRQLLRQPEPGTLLFKVVKAPYLIDMMKRSYLHFQRVDTYTDDRSDGDELPLDRKVSESMGFEKDPTYTLAKYFDASRARTYACCFSLEYSAYLWETYARGRDAVCLVFDFEKLRERLNATVQAALENDGLLIHEDIRLKQIFSINYGVVEYVDRATHALHAATIANPVQFTYLKEKSRFAKEQEFRISLGALGLGHFVLNSGERIEFPAAMQMGFNFSDAFASGVITEIRCPPNYVDAAHLDPVVRAVEQLGMTAKMMAPSTVSTNSTT